jgi:hypothetical protein
MRGLDSYTAICYICIAKIGMQNGKLLNRPTICEACKIERVHNPPMDTRGKNQSDSAQVSFLRIARYLQA